MPTRIEDAADPRVVDYVGLTDVALRRRTEPERGLYIAESEKVIRRALAAGHRPRSYLMAERWLADLADVVERAEADGIPVFVGDHAVIERLTGFHLHRGALAAMHRPTVPTVAETVHGARRVLVLEDIVDHTNVGAVFRSAAALGMDAVLVTPRMRGSALPQRRFGSRWGRSSRCPGRGSTRGPREWTALRGLGFTTAALALEEESRSLDELAADPPERLALVLGTEGDGLSRRTIAAVDLTVRIPMGGGVDSLNVAAAGAVAAWALRVPGRVPLTDQTLQQPVDLGRGVRNRPAVHGAGLEDRRARCADPAEALALGGECGVASDGAWSHIVRTASRAARSPSRSASGSTARIRASSTCNAHRSTPADWEWTTTPTLRHSPRSTRGT